jgi:hypothetical protein
MNGRLDAVAMSSHIGGRTACGAREQPTTNRGLGNRSIQFSGILGLDSSVRTGWHPGVASDAPSERCAAGFLASSS